MNMIFNIDKILIKIAFIAFIYIVNMFEKWVNYHIFYIHLQKTALCFVNYE